MGADRAASTGISRRSFLAAGGAALVPGATIAKSAARQVRAGTYNLIWNEWGPLAGYGVAAECNPGGSTNFPCGPGDVSITTGSDSTGQFSKVTANPNGIITFVNAIGNIHFQNTTPDGQPVQLKTYRYLYAIRLPLKPTTQSAPQIAEQTHQMIQFWDGSNKLWPANKHTLEAAMYWKLNPWDSDYGKIFAYTTGSNGTLSSHDTGITLPPDTNWHVFDVRADLLNRVWAGVAVDNQWNPLTNLPLAQIYHPDWGTDLSLILTAESENAYPGSTNPILTEWTTDFKDPKLYRLD
jgi:hypothetical protein